MVAMAGSKILQHDWFYVIVLKSVPVDFYLSEGHVHDQFIQISVAADQRYYQEYPFDQSF